MPKKTQKEIYETIVVGDTSALISLAIGSVLLKCLRISRILIPQEVYSELSEISQFNDVHGKAAQETIRMISNGKDKTKKKVIPGALSMAAAGNIDGQID